MTASADPLLVQACPLAQPRSWIEIRMFGADDKPLPGVAYRLVLPDGQTREGRLDGEGTARVDGITPGQCVVSFPELDEEAWEAI